MTYLYLSEELHSTTYYHEVDDYITSTSGHRFELGERIGFGGNGVVHSCQSATDDSEYAIKFQLKLSEKRKNRFEREVRLLREINHEHVIKYIASGVKIGGDTHGAQKEIPFVVMERAQMSLAALLSSGVVIKREDYVPQFRGLASALAALHSHAFHRDLKPENFLVCGDRWVIADVGLCKFHETQADDIELTAPGEFVGARNWPTPEAKRRKDGEELPITLAEDIYSLANIFWFVVTGWQWLESGPREKELGQRQLGALFGPIERALSWDHRNRQQTGEEFSGQLAELM